VMTQVDLGLTSVSRFDPADSVISINNTNLKPGASHTQYLQFGVYIDCNSNHCQVATKGLVQLQLNKHFNCKSSSTSIATQQTL
jgi:hypothetical protein